ncbi:MAG: AmmeMemoRadiSam system protein A [Holophagales bacterium]|jgi:AmmeMemoRadiSam system protein A|nr:AmmeMemoRadiSam system protein A [Holophagales bacterium]
MDPIVQLAEKAIEHFVLGAKDNIPDSFRDAIPQKKAGVFVSIHLASGDLRGCIGTISPTCKSMADEIIQNARWACSRDNRFSPIAASELGDLKIKVDVLSEPEPIDSIDELDAKKFGVIVSAKDGRRGLLLPDLEGVESIEEQIDICRRKGGIGRNEPVSLQRFTVERHG